MSCIPSAKRASFRGTTGAAPRIIKRSIVTIIAIAIDFAFAIAMWSQLFFCFAIFPSFASHNASMATSQSTFLLLLWPCVSLRALGQSSRIFYFFSLLPIRYVPTVLWTYCVVRGVLSGVEGEGSGPNRVHPICFKRPGHGNCPGLTGLTRDRW